MRDAVCDWAERAAWCSDRLHSTRHFPYDVPAMPKIELTADERDTLRDVLTSYLVELKTEIADTDAREFRELLKRKEAVIAALVERLASA